MTTPTKDPQIVKLPKVRLSYPNLFKARAMEGQQDAKFSCDLILDNKEHAQLIEQINALIERTALDEFKKKVHLKHRCLHDGNEKDDKEGYGDGKHYLVAKSDRRPVVVDADLTPLVEADGKPYGGCYVDATVRLFAWKHPTGGCGVSADLRAVRFHSDGESFGGGAPIDAENEFGDFDQPKGNGGSADPNDY